MGKPKAIVDKNICLACGGCISVCPQDALSMFGGRALVEEEKCISCAICIRICPIGAISGRSAENEV
jgi:ferredoxin